MLFEIDFEYNESTPKIYKARGQIKKGKTYTRGENDIEISIGEPGDVFPCIMLKYSFSTNTFAIDKIRKVAWGGYEQDEPVLCISPPLPEKGSLDLLIYLSLSLIYKLIEINNLDKMGKTPYISIIDGAFKNNEPLSWIKFKNNKEYTNKTTYSKYGFQLRNPNDKNNFKQYIEEEVPIYLNMKVKDIVNANELNKVFKEIDKLNSILKIKNPKKILKLNPNEKLSDFLDKIVKTGLRDDYENLLKLLNRNYNYDIRGLWYLDKKLMSPENVSAKVKILSFKL